ncbi:hypothetical protein [Proteiniborus sp. MB09-C3]|uniref:hypothetical protein n=1 Tax=Proteiniborus sp. MB09-C3 TaxID=3050072 RepID=UPI002557547C|nr:hypothetical protein [Proteiniborus sp. MB09-C3]WIV13217.1 hypothetical protein QO263_05775 [Proteiniborus sp. MB09-C3]
MRDIKMKGVYKYRLENADGSVASEGVIENCLSNANIGLLMSTWGDMSLGELDSVLFGKKQYTGFDKQTNITGTGSHTRDVKKTNCNTLLLLNMPLEDSDVVPSTPMLNIYDHVNGKFDDTKVLGIGTTNKAVDNSNTQIGILMNDKTGTFENKPEEFISDMNSRCICTWFFDEDKAVGNINKMALVNGIDIANAGGAWTCISRSNTQTNHLPPNVPNVTGENEILVANEYTGVLYYKINFVTKKITNITAVPIGIDTILSNNYLNIINYDNIVVGIKDYRNADIWEIDNITGEAILIKTVSLAYNNNYNGSIIGLYQDNDFIYATVSTTNSTDHSSYYSRLTKIAKSNYAVINSNTIDSVGNLPKVITDDAGYKCRLIINQVSNGKYAVSNGMTGLTYICTDLLDIAGTTVGTMYVGTNNDTGTSGMALNSYFFVVDGVEYCLSRMLRNKYTRNYQSRNSYKIYDDNTNDSAFTNLEVSRDVLWLSRVQDHQHWLSFGDDGNDPIPKADNQKLYVSYYIKADGSDI